MKLLALAFAWVTPAEAADVATKSYALPDKTSLELRAPAGWKDEVRPGEGALPPTIIFTPVAGAPFQVLLTPIYRPRPDVPVPTPEQIRESVERFAEQLKGQAAEANLKVLELTGASGPGYYFSATDKAPAAGEFKYLTQGMLLVGELAVTFSILTNDGQQKVRDDALGMLKSAVQKRP